jgi:sRNA-binding regulator protein Hfq
MKTTSIRIKITVASLTFLLILIPVIRIAHARPQAGDSEKTAKVKAEVARRVTQKKAKVKVKLLNGEELKGRIDQADENGFTITQDKTNKQIQMPYADVKEVKGRGGLSTAAKIGIIAAIAVGVLAIVVIVAVRNFDPFSGGITVR